MKTIRKCPACGNHTGEILYENKMKMPAEVSLPESYHIVSCNACGNCYADTSALPADYDAYYCGHNYYGAGWTCNASSVHDYAVISRMLDDAVSKDGFIMDIGCGNGGLLKYLKEQGFTNLMGIDPSADSVNSLQEYGIRAAIGSVYHQTDADIPKARAVILTMVLEHLLEPDKALENIKKQYLDKEGFVLASWPYFDDLIADDSPVINNFNHEHINYFSLVSAQRLFSRCGYSCRDRHISLGFCRNDFLMFSNIALFQSVSENSCKKEPLPKDERTKDSILKYIARQKEKEEAIAARIHELAKSRKECIVWGSGSYFMHLCSVTELEQCNITCIIDNNRLKQGRSISGFPVKSPEAVKSFRGGGVILIAVMLYGKEIEQQVRNMGNTCCEIILL